MDFGAPTPVPSRGIGRESGRVDRDQRWAAAAMRRRGGGVRFIRADSFDLRLSISTSYAGRLQKEVWQEL